MMKVRKPHLPSLMAKMDGKLEIILNSSMTPIGTSAVRSNVPVINEKTHY